MKKEILKLNIQLFDGGAPSNTTGFSEAQVNVAMDGFNTDAQNQQEVLTTSLNKIMDAIAKNWGTNDAIKHVTDNVVPEFDKLESRAKLAISQIGAAIKTTAEKQAADTNNSVSINPLKDIQVGSITNNVQEKLDNGYVGVYDSFAEDIKNAYNSLLTDYGTALATLKDNVETNCSVAFTDQGTSAVAQAAETFTGEITSSIKTSLDGLLEQLISMASEATQYSKDIQSVGLRANSGN